MTKTGIKIGLAAVSTLSLLAVVPTSAEAAGLSLRGDLLSRFSSYVQAEGVAFNDPSLNKLNTTDLYWDGVDPVEVFFVDEGAGFQNQLLFRANDNPLNMIFDNVSGSGSIMDQGNAALALGEGRGLGKFDGSTQLSFFINADGNRGGTNLFGADELTGTMVDGREVNTDGLAHMIAYNYFDDIEQENYTIIGFEDLWGVEGSRNRDRNNGYNYKVDRDFNDVVFAVKGLSQGPVEEVPEPSLLLGMLGIAALGAKGAKRKLVVA